MILNIVTLFPQIIETYFSCSIAARALQKGLIHYNCVNIRDFSANVHRNCDDAPYGGGAGMVLSPEPLGTALDSIDAKNKHVIYLTPSGIPLRQPLVDEFAKMSEVVIICGRYEGIDQRVVDEYVDREVSIGDYVISAGEVAALVIVDAIYRLIEGVITKESLQEESFRDGLLEYPHYTRPEIWRGRQVPAVLLSGHHQEIANWRLKKRKEKTEQLQHTTDMIYTDIE